MPSSSTKFTLLITHGKSMRHPYQEYLQPKFAPLRILSSGFVRQTLPSATSDAHGDTEGTPLALEHDIGFRWCRYHQLHNLRATFASTSG